MSDEKETKDEKASDDAEQDAPQEEEKKEEAPEEAKEEKKEETNDAPKEAKEEPKDESTEAGDDDSSDDGEPVEVPKKFQALVEQVESMSVLELNELVKLLEKKFGVSAAAVAVAGPAGDAEAEEKDEFTVELKSAGDSKIGVIKAVKAALGLGLKEAKDLVESAPTVLKENVKKEEAEEMKTSIEEAGGQVELK